MLKLWAMLAVLVTAMATSPALADRRVALVIGNSAYESVPALPNPAADARAIAASLSAIGFEVLLREDLSQAEMAKALGDYTTELRGADVGLFYYAGHGVQVDLANYLVATNATLENAFLLNSDAIALDAIVGAMESAAPVNLVFIDACRDNPFLARLKASMPAERSAGLQRGLAPLKGHTGDTMIVYATASNQTAADGTGAHSPFATALLKHIATPSVEVSLLLKRVIQDVRVSTDYKQNPEVLSAMATEFYFAVPPASGPGAGTGSPQTTISTDPNPAADAGKDLVVATTPAEEPRPTPTGKSNGGFDTSVLAALDVDAAIDAAQGEVVLTPTPEEIEAALGLAREDVIRIQTALSAMGYDLGTADGSFGKRSREALKAFQATNRVPQSGFLDTKTIEAVIKTFEAAPKTYDGKWRIDIHRRWLVQDDDYPHLVPGSTELLATLTCTSSNGQVVLVDFQIRAVMPDEPFSDFSARIDESGRLHLSGQVSTMFSNPEYPVADLKPLRAVVQLPRIMPYNRKIDGEANNLDRNLDFAVSVVRLPS